MRNELTLIEKIEAYLNGQLAVEENAAFEQEITVDAALKEKVDLQRQLSAGLERSAWRALVQKVSRKYKMRKRLQWVTVVVLVILSAVAVWYVSGKYLHHYAAVPAESTPLPVQYFRINPSVDTVLETAGGITFSILANTFQDSDGQLITAPVDVAVKEALDGASIIQSGLSTKSGNALLETGGMFYIDASAGGASLQLRNPIYTEIPAETVQAGMQLYKGELRRDGIVNWINPVPLDHDLTLVDIERLNFYPPAYLYTLFTLGYDTLNKAFTDSLYYSFAASFVERDSSRTPCGLNPASVQAIWTEQFQQTIIATRQFEERMYWLHKVGDGALLDLYVRNLDKSLSAIDSMVANKLSGAMKEQFLLFAARHDGKVKSSSAQRQQLQQYYKMKSAAFTAAVLQTQKAYQQREDSLKMAAAARKAQYERKMDEQDMNNFREELTLNTQSVYRQLGYDRPRRTTVPSNVYAASITSTGWYNIDREVTEATIAKQSAIITANGKQAVISYQPVTFKVDSGYDRVYVYLLPDQLTSYIRLFDEGGRYTDKLNSLMKYNVVCLAYKGEQAFFYAAQHVQPGTHTVLLEEIGEKTLSVKLSQYTSQHIAKDIRDDEKYLYQIFLDEQQEKKRAVTQDLFYRIWHVIFPCYMVAAAPAIPEFYSAASDTGNAEANAYLDINDFMPDSIKMLNQ
jgi:hypothetical protein